MSHVSDVFAYLLLRVRVDLVFFNCGLFTKTHSIHCSSNYDKIQAPSLLLYYNKNNVQKQLTMQIHNKR